MNTPICAQIRLAITKKCLLNMGTLFLYATRSGLSPQSCLYYQGFWASKLLSGSLVVRPSKLCLQGIHKFSGFKTDIYDQRF